MNKVFFGDCRDTMRDLIAHGVKVQMCVTSPPYYGLRDYGHTGQLGLEETPAEYVAAMVEVFALVRDLLADDGVLWLNIGDSYATQPGKGNNVPQTKWKANAYPESAAHRSLDCGVKPKNLLGIPWRVAFALQADGWYLRQDVIWSKPNAMPESVTDRCTKAHEYLFLLSKSERYYFDHEAIKEPAISEHAPGNKTHKHTTAYEEGATELRTKAGLVGYANKMRERKGCPNLPGVEMRHRRSVWEVPTQPYTGAHFAVFPPALIEPCILAGSRSGDTVLDCFFGSGTTGEVAGNLGRNWIGCEINDQYAPLQQARTAQRGLAF